LRLHKVPTSIVFDWDVHFVAMFWKILHKALTTTLNFSAAHHPHTNAQSGRTT